MSYEKNYENNIQALQGKNFSLFEKLRNFNENKRYDVITLSDGIDILDTHTNIYLYNRDPKNSVNEKIKLFKETYSIFPFTYHFGIGNGDYYYWLLHKDKTSRVVIIEPEIEVLFIALHLHDFSKKIKHDTLALFLAEDFNYVSAANLFMYIKGPLYFSKLFSLDIHTPYYENEKYNIVEINKYFTQAIVQAALNCGNDPADTYLGIKQHIGNLAKVIENPSLKELTSKCKSTDTAIIVATGPSLAKQLPLLKKIQNYVTIFAVDASFPILSDYGIKSDIVVSIERGKTTKLLYEHSKKEYFQDTIFAFTSVLHSGVLDAIQDNSQISFSFRDYTYIRFFELYDFCCLGKGASAANMAYELAIQSQFKKCVLIGQDLAFGEDGHTHSSGHIHGEKADYVNTSGGRRVQVVKYGGDGVVETNSTWKYFKNFYESEIALNNQKGVETFNATEGGARILGTIELPFSKVIDLYVEQSLEKKTIKLTQPTVETIGTLKKQIDDKTTDMILSLIKIKEETKKIHSSINKITAKVNKENAFVSCSNSLMKKVKKLSNDIDKLKTKIAIGPIDILLNTVLGTSLTHLEMETAVLIAKPKNTQRDYDVFALQWPFVHREWSKQTLDSIEHMINAIGLGLLIQENYTILEKLYDEEKIKFLKENSNLYDFESEKHIK